MGVLKQIDLGLRIECEGQRSRRPRQILLDRRSEQKWRVALSNVFSTTVEVLAGVAIGLLILYAMILGMLAIFS